MRSRTVALIVLALIAFLFGPLMLAKLFGSDVLGWSSRGRSASWHSSGQR